jgi:hypothetical protein
VLGRLEEEEVEPVPPVRCAGSPRREASERLDDERLLLGRPCDDPPRSERPPDGRSEPPRPPVGRSDDEDADLGPDWPARFPDPLRPESSGRPDVGRAPDGRVLLVRSDGDRWPPAGRSPLPPEPPRPPPVPELDGGRPWPDVERLAAGLPRAAPLPGPRLPELPEADPPPADLRGLSSSGRLSSALMPSAFQW